MKLSFPYKIIIILFLVITLTVLLFGFTKNTRVEGFNSSTMFYNPIYIKEHDIYDIFYNDNGNIVIIMANLKDLPNVSLFDQNTKTYIPFKYNICPHKHTYVFYIKHKYSDTIQIKVNKEVLKTKINKYPKFNKDEIIFSTLVKDEDNYIIQWIQYHKKLGVSKFIIYDNSSNNTLQSLLRDYINNNEVILIQWNYVYNQKAQQTQQNHSIYAFQNVKFIGLFDVDEYVNIQSKTNIPNFFDTLIREKNINLDNTSSFRIVSKLFYNPNNLDTSGTNFLRIPNCSPIVKNEREKNFVIPKNVKTFSVHTVTDGLPIYDVDERYIFFNHYFYLNKPNRGKDKTSFTDDSILRHLTI